jgi:hypothetical protein
LRGGFSVARISGEKERKNSCIFAVSAREIVVLLQKNCARSMRKSRMNKKSENGTENIDSLR